jgi:Dihaem cytochrome c
MSPSQTMAFCFKSPMDSNDPAMHTTGLTNTVLRVPNKLIRAVAIGVAVVSAAVMFIASLANAQTPAATSKTKQETTATTTKPVKVEALSGAELWTMNCNRCHMTRTPGEFTAAQWRTIFRHMRIRANLPADQARELQRYLEAGAGK